MCCGLVKGKMILQLTILSGGLVNVYSIYLNGNFNSHTSYVLVVQESNVSLRRPF